MCKSYFSRFRETGGPGCTKRFIHTMDMFFIAVAKQVDDHANECSTRRDTSTCKPCFALIEYALQIDLPDEVTSHSVIVAMEEAANDYICFTNDIVSYNKEQSTGHDTHNVITVLMHARGLDLPKCCAIQRFDDHQDLDRQVAMYIEGLQNCMVGALHWHFGSSRYSGQDGHAVKRDQIIKLLPKCPL
ncbi:isoprenoid synthase domain-containing protein [Suillus paluster]|uniref:isoprenoid synthase domain-containing protein n=1 Tax=Suillus paluster TaxID=48578 RepID=UPI001B88676A|nr:isoprenoid synthase domain-containing protein [Suillus paluster]KAG1723076.1 isoprenoid synthase domain-containing protein [Suillus paluster]